MHLTPRELDKLMVYMMAEVALKRKAKGLKLNHPEAVAVITASALDGAREGKTLEQVMKEARTTLSRNDVMEGVAEMIPLVQLRALHESAESMRQKTEQNLRVKSEEMVMMVRPANGKTIALDVQSVQSC